MVKLKAFLFPDFFGMNTIYLKRLYEFTLLHESDKIVLLQKENTTNPSMAIQIFYTTLFKTNKKYVEFEL